MSEQARDEADGLYDRGPPGDPNGELVHWMEPKPLSVGAAGISAAAAGAFALGAAAAVAALALLHMLGPQRRWRVSR